MCQALKAVFRCYNAHMETTLHIKAMTDWDSAAQALLTRLPVSHPAATVVTFTGDLGAGKTTFVQAIARALFVAESVTSPTFTIMRRYELHNQSFKNLVHVDAYRVDDPQEMTVLHFAATLAEAGTLVCIEWPEKIPSVVPEVAATVAIDFLPESEDRIVTIHV